MSAEHRKPVAAFVMLALMAAGVIGIQRAEAQAGRLLVAMIGTSAEVHGTLPAVSETTRAVSLARSSDLGPAFVALAAVAAAPDQAPVVAVSGGRPVTVAPAQHPAPQITTQAPRPVTGARGTDPATDRARHRGTRRGGRPDDTRSTQAGSARSQESRPVDPQPVRGRREAAHQAAVGQQATPRPAAVPRPPAHPTVSTPGPSNELGHTWLPPGQQARHG